MIEVKPLTNNLLPNAGTPIDFSPERAGCSGMCCLIPVAKYYGGEPAANRRLVLDLKEIL